MNKIIIFILSTLSFFAVGCSTKNFEADWILVSALNNGTKVIIPEGNYANMSSSRTTKTMYDINGYSGVNFYTGISVLDGKKIALKVNATTMMSSSPEDEKFESDFLEIILNISKIKLLKSNKMVLQDKTGKYSATFEKQSLVNTKWRLSAYNTGNAVEYIEDNNDYPTLVIEENKISGSSGINSYMASYIAEKEKHSINFGNIGSTKMAGPEKMMTLENRFLELMNKVNSYELSGPLLTLKNEDEILLIFYSEE